MTRACAAAASTLFLLALMGCAGNLSTNGPSGELDGGLGAASDGSPSNDGAAVDSVVPFPDAAAPAEPDAAPQPVDCAGIAADPDYELCESDATRCAGVFTDGSGCFAYCAAAGLVCSARFGGAPGCQKEPANVLSCFEESDHDSDWCECKAAGGGGTCQTEPGTPPVLMELGIGAAVFTERHNWVVDCRPYAYTAGSTEHEACDAEYSPDGNRTGTATFSFEAVPPGSYDVYIYSRHTANRNSAGALFYVNDHSKIIMQKDDADYVWDFHGSYCLDGLVNVVLDSTVNSGSDSVARVRLAPTP